MVTKLRLPLALPPASSTMLGTRFHICAQRQGPLSDLWPKARRGLVPKPVPLVTPIDPPTTLPSDDEKRNYNAGRGKDR